MAMSSTPSAKVTLNNVHLNIQKHFKYYRVANPGWKVRSSTSIFFGVFCRRFLVLLPLPGALSAYLSLM